MTAAVQVTDIDEDLVSLANSLFNSEEVIQNILKPNSDFYFLTATGAKSSGELFSCCQPRKSFL